MFLPWAVPSFISGLAWAWLFNPIIGPLPHWLFALGVLAAPDNILADPVDRHVGADHRQCLVGRAVLRDHAAGRDPGDPETRCTRRPRSTAPAPWMRFVNVTLPFLAPTIAITVLLRTIWISNFADLIVVMTGGGPANTTQILPSYIFTTAYKKLDFGYAATISMALLLPPVPLLGGPDPAAPQPEEHGVSTAGARASRRYAAILGYVLFALFPLFWLVKISFTPGPLLYSEGIRLWPSATTLDNFRFVLLQSQFPYFFANSVTGLGRHGPRRSRCWRVPPATRSRASPSAPSPRSRSCCC